MRFQFSMSIFFFVVVDWTKSNFICINESYLVIWELMENKNLAGDKTTFRFFLAFSDYNVSTVLRDKCIPFLFLLRITLEKFIAINKKVWIKWGSATQYQMVKIICELRKNQNGNVPNTLAATINPSYISHIVTAIYF